ncbi:hypothetical protein HFA01_08690 [Halobacillus faecis]|uniref:Uncharacterized protein n=1 Tax=Halobacillus faecis TaxID=360184 RepID=A0A511WNH5_9BACI|nr:hypothetical protein HFA01_08690 [Halobacillus faecis]
MWTSMLVLSIAKIVKNYVNGISLFSFFHNMNLLSWGRKGHLKYKGNDNREMSILIGK